MKTSSPRPFTIPILLRYSLNTLKIHTPLLRRSSRKRFACANFLIFLSIHFFFEGYVVLNSESASSKAFSCASLMACRSIPLFLCCSSLSSRKDGSSYGRGEASSISSTERCPQVRIYSSLLIFPFSTSSRRRRGFMQSRVPTQPPHKRLDISSPATFVIFLRVPKRGASDVPLAPMIADSPSLSFGRRFLSQYSFRAELLSSSRISVMRVRQIEGSSSTIFFFSFLLSLDLFFGKTIFLICFQKSLLLKGERGTDTPAGIVPTRSVMALTAFFSETPKLTSPEQMTEIFM